MQKLDPNFVFDPNRGLSPIALAFRDFNVALINTGEEGQTAYLAVTADMATNPMPEIIRDKLVSYGGQVVEGELLTEGREKWSGGVVFDEAGKTALLAGMGLQIKKINGLGRVDIHLSHK